MTNSTAFPPPPNFAFIPVNIFSPVSLGAAQRSVKSGLFERAAGDLFSPPAAIGPIAYNCQGVETQTLATGGKRGGEYN